MVLLGVLIPLSRPQLHYNQYADVPGPPARLECRLRGCTYPSHSTIGACIVTPGVKSVKIRKPRPHRLTAGFYQLFGSRQASRAPASGTCPSYGPLLRKTFQIFHFLQHTSRCLQFVRQVLRKGGHNRR